MLSGACGDAVSYEIVRTAAEAFGPPGGQADTRTAAQRRMDGLVAACKAALDGGYGPGAARQVPAHQQCWSKTRPWPRPPPHDGQPPAPPRHARHRPTPTLPPTPGPGRVPRRGCGAAGRHGWRGAWPGGGARPGPGAGRPRRPDPGRRGQRLRPEHRPGPAVSAGAGAPPGRTGHGTMLTARQVLALCCGAQISAIRWRDGLPLDVGRDHAHRTPRAAPRPGSPRPRLPLDRVRRAAPPGPPPTTSAPGARAAPPACEDMALFCHLHHHYFIHTPRLDHHRRPQRHPLLHPPRRLAHPATAPSPPPNRPRHRPPRRH